MMCIDYVVDFVDILFGDIWRLVKFGELGWNVGLICIDRGNELMDFVVEKGYFNIWLLDEELIFVGMIGLEEKRYGNLFCFVGRIKYGWFVFDFGYLFMGYFYFLVGNKLIYLS